jgi:hypothetical protein
MLLGVSLKGYDPAAYFTNGQPTEGISPVSLSMESDRIGSQVGGLPTGSTGPEIFSRIPPVDLWATLLGLHA